MPSSSCARTSRISRDGSTTSAVLVNEAAYSEGDNRTCSRNLADLNVALIDGLRWEGYTRKVFGRRHVNVSAPQHGRTDEDDCDCDVVWCVSHIVSTQVRSYARGTGWVGGGLCGWRLQAWQRAKTKKCECTGTRSASRCFQSAELQSAERVCVQKTAVQDFTLERRSAARPMPESSASTPTNAARRTASRSDGKTEERFRPSTCTTRTFAGVLPVASEVAAVAGVRVAAAVVVVAAVCVLELVLVLAAVYVASAECVAAAECVPAMRKAISA
jgi:hypothetical protein